MDKAMRAAWQQGHLDARCRDCGETYPARNNCLHCGSRDMEFREHVAGPRPGEPGAREAQWCQQVKYPTAPDPTHPLTGRRRAPRPVSVGVSPEVAGPDVDSGTLWPAA